MDAFYVSVEQLLSKTEAGSKKVRLLGISISNFDDQHADVDKYGQRPLPLKFPDAADATDG